MLEIQNEHIGTLNPHMHFVADSDMGLFSIENEKRQWCRDNLGKAGRYNWFVVSSKGFKFARKEDATAFKLRWITNQK